MTVTDAQIREFMSELSILQDQYGLGICLHDSGNLRLLEFDPAEKTDDGVDLVKLYSLEGGTREVAINWAEIDAAAEAEPQTEPNSDEANGDEGDEE